MFVTCFYCCPDLQGVLCNEVIYQAAAKDAFPQYNKDQMLAIELSDGSGHVCYLSISIIHTIGREKHRITWSFLFIFPYALIISAIPLVSQQKIEKVIDRPYVRSNIIYN